MGLKVEGRFGKPAADRAALQKVPLFNSTTHRCRSGPGAPCLLDSVSKKPGNRGARFLLEHAPDLFQDSLIIKNLIIYL